MREVVLDIRPLSGKRVIHQYLKDQLALSLYYGANLDALYDELTSLSKPITIILQYSISLNGAQKPNYSELVRVFADAARDNDFLSVRFVGYL